MPDSTINYALPYPTGGDAVAVHSDLQALAVKADAELAAVRNQVGSDIASAIAPLATSAELSSAVAPLATSAEVDDKIATATDTSGLLSTYLAARGA